MGKQRILIVSDNIYICTQIAQILEAHPVSITFKHSKGSPIGYLASLSKSTDLQDDVVDLKVEDEVEEIIRTFDLVISAHCKQLFPERLFSQVRCINIHPGYNPINRGWYPQVFAIVNHLDIGATIHEVSGELDGGPIICREKVKMYAWDTSFTVYNRVVEKEIELFQKHAASILTRQYVPFDDEDGTVFLKADFKKLCEIDTKKVGTFQEFIDLLRALTHAPYNNAYFFLEDGTKVFVGITLTVDHDKEK